MYIFLDVDGVMNRESDWKRIYTVNPECVAAFKKLLQLIDHPKIVLSSTWRSGIDGDGKLSEPLKELLFELSDCGVFQLDKTAIAPDGMRDKEIGYYLRRHEKDNYLILDDDVSLFTEGKGTKNLYLTDSKRGLTNADAAKIKKL